MSHKNVPLLFSLVFLEQLLRFLYKWKQKMNTLESTYLMV